jgi:hypothetical protein
MMRIIMDYKTKIGEALDKELPELCFSDIPKYGVASCTASCFATTKGCWNIEVNFSVENGGISDVYFENSDNPDIDFYIDSPNLVKDAYPDLYEHIESEIFRMIDG